MAFEIIDDRWKRTSVAQRKLTISVVSAKTDSVTLPINGELLNYVTVAPNLTTDSTFDFTIVNEDSETVYTNTGIADNSSVVTLTSAAPIPMSGTLTFTITFVTSQTAEFTIYLYYK